MSPCLFFRLFDTCCWISSDSRQTDTLGSLCCHPRILFFPGGCNSLARWPLMLMTVACLCPCPADAHIQGRRWTDRKTIRCFQGDLHSGARLHTVYVRVRLCAHGCACALFGRPRFRARSLLILTRTLPLAVWHRDGNRGSRASVRSVSATERLSSDQTLPSALVATSLSRVSAPLVRFT